MDKMEQLADVTRRMDVLRNIAAKGWPSGVVIGFCPKCKKQREYTWDDVAKMMARGLPRCKCSGERIDLRID